MPNLPFSPPVTLDELYRNIVHDLGAPSETSANVDFVSLKGVLTLMNNGLWNASLGTYGSGIDGALHFAALANGAGAVTLWNGTTITASSNTYTLTQDLWLGQTEAANVVSWPIIDPGVTINANGFRIFCQGLLQNGGTIQSNGANAAGTTAGAALSYTSTISSTTVGSAGGTGATTGNNSGTNQTISLGGAGGAGGNNASAAGGAGGTVTRPGATAQLPFSLPLATMGKAQTTTALTVLTAGSGGGSGQGDAGNNSGAGGGGGGILVVAAQRIAGGGVISTNGGAGSNAVATGNSGGGGGGGGGLTIVVSRSVQSNSVVATANVAGQTVSATGGAGGLGNGQANGNGAAGANGFVVLLGA